MVVGDREYALEAKLNGAHRGSISMVPGEGHSKGSRAGAEALQSRKRPMDLA